MNEIGSVLNAELEARLMKILKRGGSIELKRENGRLVFVELSRHVIFKETLRDRAEGEGQTGP